jgi:hypothetical protein
MADSATGFRQHRCLAGPLAFIPNGTGHQDAYKMFGGSTRLEGFHSCRSNPPIPNQRLCQPHPKAVGSHKKSQASAMRLVGRTFASLPHDALAHGHPAAVARDLHPQDHLHGFHGRRGAEKMVCRRRRSCSPPGLGEPRRRISTACSTSPGRGGAVKPAECQACPSLNNLQQLVDRGVPPARAGCFTCDDILR